MTIQGLVGKTVTVNNNKTLTVMYATLAGKDTNPKSKWYGKQVIQLSGKDAMGLTVRVKTDSMSKIEIH